MFKLYFLTTIKSSILMWNMSVQAVTLHYCRMGLRGPGGLQCFVHLFVEKTAEAWSRDAITNTSHHTTRASWHDVTVDDQNTDSSPYSSFRTFICKSLQGEHWTWARRERRVWAVDTVEIGRYWESFAVEEELGYKIYYTLQPIYHILNSESNAQRKNYTMYTLHIQSTDTLNP